MVKICAIMDKNRIKLTAKLRRFVADERGDFGIAQIGAIVATLVVLGLIVSLLQGGIMQTWITDIWGWFTLWVTSILS